MNMTTVLRVLSLFFFLSLSKVCMAQDWAKPLEASTVPTDYQAILDNNLAIYTSSSIKNSNYTTLASYEFALSLNVQNGQSSGLPSMLKAYDQSFGQNTLIGTLPSVFNEPKVDSRTSIRNTPLRSNIL